MKTIAVALAVAFFTASTATAAFVVTSRDIKNGTIQSIDLSAKTKRSLRSQRGPIGPPGPAGTFSAANVTEARGNIATVPPGGVGSSQAFCPSGVAIAGGWDGLESPPIDATMAYNQRYGATSWGVIFVNWSSLTATLQATVICAGTGFSSLGAEQAEFLRDAKTVRESRH